MRTRSEGRLAMSRSLDFFFSCSCWILTGVGCLMEEVKAPLAWAWDLPQKGPSATFGRLGLTACGSNAGAMDGDPRRLPVSGHEITRRSFGSRRARLPRSHQGRLGWSEMGKVDGKDKRKSRRAGQGWWVSQMQGPSAFLEDFLPLSPFSLLLFCPLFPCPVGCPLRSVDVVPTEPSSKDQRPASTRPRWDAATATAQTQSISFGLGLVTHRRPPALSRCI